MTDDAPEPAEEAAEKAGPATSLTDHPEWAVTTEQLIEFDPNWVVFWGDSIVASQLELWLPYLRRSRYRYVLLSSVDRANPLVPRLLDGFDNGMVAMPYESVVPALRKCRRLKGVLYPTTRPANFAMVTAMQFLSHVWLGHGESEKGVNGPRTGSLYDSVLMARYKAIDRFPKAIRRWVGSGACAIGAPLVEGITRSPWASPRPVRTILYAPTWEGRRPKMDYSSLPEVVPILTALLPSFKERGVTLIVRPHPGTGQRDPAYKQLVNDLFAAGATRPGRKADDFAAADVMVSDVSGVTAEWLFTEKPVIMPLTANAVTEGRDAESLAAEYPWAYQWKVSGEDFQGLIDGLATSDPLRGRRASSARDMFRGHRNLDEAARTFDLALSCAGRRDSRIGVRLAFEFKVRTGIARRLFGRPRRRPRRRRAALR